MDTSTGHRRLLIDLAGQPLRLIDSEAELRALIAEHRATRATRVYEVAASPRLLGDLPQAASLFDDTAGAAVIDASNAEALDRFNHELAVLDRPLDDDVEYYDEPGPSRWPRPGAIAAAVAVAVGGYLLWQSRDGLSDPGLAAQAGQEAIQRPRASPSLPVPAPEPALRASSPAPPVPSAPVASAAGAAQPANAPGEVPVPAPLLPRAAANEEVRRDGAPSRASVTPYARLVAGGGRLLERGRNGEAMELFRQALNQRPEAPEALTGLGYAYLDRGKNAHAATTFKRALGFDPAHAPALFGLAEVYRVQGRRAAAVEALQRFLVIQPSGRDADIARRQIQQLASSSDIPSG